MFLTKTCLVTTFCLKNNKNYNTNFKNSRKLFSHFGQQKGFLLSNKSEQKLKNKNEMIIKRVTSFSLALLSYNRKRKHIQQHLRSVAQEFIRTKDWTNELFINIHTWDWNVLYKTKKFKFSSLSACSKNTFTEKTTQNAITYIYVCVCV